jgi:hypothetical protein
MRVRAAFAPSEESKVVSSNPLMSNPRPVRRAFAFALLLAVFSATHVSVAHGQAGFSLTPSGPQPKAVDPGEVATATIDVTSIGGFSGLVTLTCAVTSNVVTSSPPVCAPVSQSVTPSAIASLTFTTLGTPAGAYTITVTGTSGSIVETTTLLLNVVDVPQDYTLAVTTGVSPSTVTAGNGAQATLTVTPIASYNGSVTLSCLSITPTVTAAPACSFNPPTVQVTSGPAPTSVLTITTIGTLTTGKNVSAPRMFYALWIGMPGFVLLGMAVGGKRRRTLSGLLLLIALGGSVLSLPSCSASHTTANNGLVTPKNTYTFTLTGVDANGVSPSNTNPTVSLTVN